MHTRDDDAPGGQDQPGKQPRVPGDSDLQHRVVLTVAEAGRLLGISRNSAYEAVRRGELPAVRIGRRLIVPKAALDRLLSGGAGNQ